MCTTSTEANSRRYGFWKASLLLLTAFLLTSCSTPESASDSAVSPPPNSVSEPVSPPLHETRQILLSDHPRILLLEDEVADIHQAIATNPYWANMHDVILGESDRLIEEPVLERTMIGRRLLGTSREALRRVFFLSYAYRMTGDDRYSDRAEEEMVAAASFEDWNPSHFLDVAEMTMALAIGYDWLHDALGAGSRELIQSAILTKGLEPSFDPDYNWFLEASHNWNQVCNAGMTYGALAIYDEHPDIAREVIERAIETIPLAKKDYEPVGSYPEGYGYWGYGTSFNVMFLSALDKAWADGFDYGPYSAFLNTGRFRKHMTGTTLSSFNWGDNGASASLSPSMFWFADKNSEPSLLWREIHWLETADYSDFVSNRLLPAIMIWGKNIPFDGVSPPEETMYVTQGDMPLSIMRTSWEPSEGIFLGFKGGSPSVNHGHMDIGSFVMESDGVRWASDLGAQNYNSLETLGMNIWDRAQDSERWSVYRLNNFSHSTLTVNDQLQRVDGYSKIETWSDDPDFRFATIDMSSLYSGELFSAKRGAGIVDQEYVVVRDELRTGDEPATVRWQMLTEADVELRDESSAILRRDGQELTLQVVEPEQMNGRIPGVQTWSTQPETDFDAENPGTILVGFEFEVPANTRENVQVALIPGSSEIEPAWSASLAEWSADFDVRGDLDVVRRRVIDELLEPTVDDQEISGLMEALHSDGYWPDIDYVDTTRTAFEHSVHLSNMVTMGRAFKKSESDYYQDQSLKQAIWRALDFWIENDFIGENWWNNQIGTPQRIGDLLLIMDEDLTEDQILGTAPILGRGSLGSWGARPGGDLMHIAGIQGNYGLFKRDVGILNEAVEAIAKDIRFAVDRGDSVDTRGLQTDYSFHHRHDRVTSTITYGNVYANYFINWAERLASTGFEMPEESIELITDFYLDGISKTMAFGVWPDPGARNRGISRRGALNAASPVLLEKLLRISSYREDELEALASARKGGEFPDWSSSQFFWHTEYFSHQRPGYFSSVRMYSSRNHSMEVPYNSEGLKNHHLADGYNFITRSGEEYVGIFPVWDWQKVPGTTVVQKPSLPDPSEIQQPGRTDFVGGITDGMYGSAVFDFKSPLDPLSAKKVWFFFDDEYIAMGTGIFSDSEYPVVTTLNQSLLKGEVVYGGVNGEEVLDRGDHALSDINWVFHDQIAYIFPEPGNVQLTNREQSGSWYDITDREWARELGEVQKDVFTLWLEHEVAPKGEAYAYIVVPGIEAEEVERYRSNSPVEILSNAPDVQAVHHGELQISQVVFYEPAEVEIPGGVRIEAETPGLILMKRADSDRLEFTVSDPSRTLDRFRFRIFSSDSSRSLESFRASSYVEGGDDKAAQVIWNEEDRSSLIEINLPDGEFAGQSVGVTLVVDES